MHLMCWTHQGKQLCGFQACEPGKHAVTAALAPRRLAASSRGITAVSATKTCRPRGSQGSNKPTGHVCACEAHKRACLGAWW